MLRHHEFDVAEMSLSSYVTSLAAEPAPFVALPVFTSRMFRHGGIFVNADAGIEKPADLRGKVVGTPECQLTAGVWIRGILADHHDVPVDSVRYLTGGQETPGRIEKGKVDPGRRRHRRSSPARRSRRCSPSGEIDALHSPAGAVVLRARATRACADCSPTSSPPRRTTSRPPASSRSCTWSSSGGTSTSAHPWVAQSLPRR